MSSSSPDSRTDPGPDPVIYGQLFVLGCNGSLPRGDTERMKSRFVLRQREMPNGVRPSTVHPSYTPQAAKVVSSRLQHSISFKVTHKHTVVVEYVPDSNTDLFQIGRSTEPPIDFVVTGADPAAVSRFSCRIVCSRTPPYSARIYAAGFDDSNNIVLGEKAAKWRTADGHMDALTTNGVLVMNPGPGFGLQSKPRSSEPGSCESGSSEPGSSERGSSEPGLWKEVSVCGDIFTLRETRAAQKRGAKVKGESNLLVDGSLVDLCGVMLLWRSTEGLSLSPTDALLESYRQELNSERPQCPVGYYTLSFPSRPPQLDFLKPDQTPGLKLDPKQPWVYMRCGHVHGYLRWGNQCPMCRTNSVCVPLWLGLERGFYVDSEKPTHALAPCGHVCSQRTAEYWSHVRMPRMQAPVHVHASEDVHGFQALCPFCLKPLDTQTPYVQLIFQTPY
ncbi:E3 ubiquitin-protein ligase pellino homolog 1-like isoform X1 [Periophthalmus magnuspinnatus]|uniref:E3 ubiquitin-protein ligase pellino homolog 1-like isoform X1 n=1 Tax=Periophthalmus magnuspinnatus TaxID=409849 RepID=UPI00145A3B7F|nr:E3 ubiquitin-protein ligase pellino homolog 1-like isoform X1 [Periophthalmus magnuspinnatus]